MATLFLPNFLVNPESKEDQNLEVSKRLHGIFKPYYRDLEGRACVKGSEGCTELKNFYVECPGSHKGEKGDSGLNMPLKFDSNEVKVSIFDCSEDEKEVSCSLKSYL